MRRILLPAALLLLTAAAQAQSPEPPGDSAYKAECDTLIQQWAVIVTGRLPEPQRAARVHHHSASELNNFAARSATRGQHYLACVTYAYAAATYYTDQPGDPHKAQRHADRALRFAEIEQHLGDHIANPGEKLVDHTFAITHAANKVMPGAQNPIEQLPSPPTTLAKPVPTPSQPKTP